ncbi:uncharacterized protein TNCV_996991 [Trichonephila clavipes]|nr:uncharacterized protein TNCV_996991 [Trichonephila clavipes]
MGPGKRSKTQCRFEDLSDSIFKRKWKSCCMAAIAEWYRDRIVACLVTSSCPVPLKTHRVGQRCTLNLSRAETSNRWCGVVVRVLSSGLSSSLGTSEVLAEQGRLSLSSLLQWVGMWSGREKNKSRNCLTRERVENREGSLGYPGFVKPVFTKDSKPLGKRKRSQVPLRRQAVDFGKGVYLIQRPTGPQQRRAYLRRLRRKETLFWPVVKGLDSCSLKLVEGGIAA